MAHAGQELSGPNGYVLCLLRTAAETGGEVLEMEATYRADGPPPPEHSAREAASIAGFLDEFADEIRLTAG